MKGRKLLLLLLVLAASCQDAVKSNFLRDVNHEFSRVYALKDASPDSAMVIMDAIVDTLDESALLSRSKLQYAEFQILLAELNYKNYRPIDNDSLVFRAFDIIDSILPGTNIFSENKELAFQKARAYYYKAVVEEQNTKQHVSAFEDYLKSLWIMDGLRGKRRVFNLAEENIEYEHFVALIYDRLAWFLYTYDVWDTSLECLEKSNECFLKEDNLLGVASNLELMGDVMLAQGDKVESLVYYKRSDSIHERHNTDNIYQHFSILIHRALDLYNMGEKDACYDLLHHTLEMTESDWLSRQVRFSLGYFYFENQQFDSALFNYERSYPLLPRQTIKSYCRIIKAANILGDSVKSANYGELLSDLYLNQVAQSGDRTKLIMHYEQNKADGKDARQKDVFYFILLVVTLLVIIIFIDIIYINRRKRRHKLEIEAHEKIQASLEDEIVTTKIDSKQMEEKIKSLETELEKAVSNPDFQKLPFDQKMEALYEMPISKRVRKVMNANVKAGSSYPELVLSENQLTMLVNAVDAVFPKFSIQIIERFPRMKRSDVVYCCMYILGVTEVQAAALTGKTYQAVWTRSMKLHEIFDNKSNLQLVLHNFLKDW